MMTLRIKSIIFTSSWKMYKMARIGRAIHEGWKNLTKLSVECLMMIPALKNRML